MDSAEEDVWAGVSAERIERSRAYFERAARLAYSYSCSILLGCPQRPTADTRSGTGVFLRLDDRHYVVTARHVVTAYVEMRSAADHVHFQIGDLTIDPIWRLAYEDKATDIAVIEVRPEEVPAIGRSPFLATADWPIPAPQVGQMIEFCGFAKINRVNGEAGKIDSTILPLMGKVANSQETQFSVRFERKDFRWDGEILLQSHQLVLGGMSGGPALLLDDPRHPLIGIIVEGIDALDVVYFSTLAHVPWPLLG